jgi:hypothetical protein
VDGAALWVNESDLRAADRKPAVRTPRATEARSAPERAAIVAEAAEWRVALAGLCASPPIPLPLLRRHLAVDPDVLAGALTVSEGALELITLNPFPENHHGQDWLLLLCLLGRRVASVERVDRSVHGSLLIDRGESWVVSGDLRVGGDLDVRGRLLVLGDLEVGGLCEDDYSSGAAVVVGGDLRSGRGLRSEGFLHVGGRLEAKGACLSFNQGYARVLGGFRGDLLLERDHGGSWIFGKVEATLCSTDELRFEKGSRMGNTPAERIHAELSPELRRAVSDPTDAAELERVITWAWRMGRPVLASQSGRSARAR